MLPPMSEEFGKKTSNKATNKKVNKNIPTGSKRASVRKPLDKTHGKPPTTYLETTIMGDGASSILRDALIRLSREDILRKKATSHPDAKNVYSLYDTDGKKEDDRDKEKSVLRKIIEGTEIVAKLNPAIVVLDHELLNNGERIRKLVSDSHLVPIKDSRVVIGYKTPHVKNLIHTITEIYYDPMYSYSNSFLEWLLVNAVGYHLPVIAPSNRKDLVEKGEYRGRTKETKIDLFSWGERKELAIEPMLLTVNADGFFFKKHLSSHTILDDEHHAYEDWETVREKENDTTYVFSTMIQQHTPYSLIVSKPSVTKTHLLFPPENEDKIITIETPHGKELTYTAKQDEVKRFHLIPSEKKMLVEKTYGEAWKNKQSMFFLLPQLPPQYRKSLSNYMPFYYKEPREHRNEQDAVSARQFFLLEQLMTNTEDPLLEKEIRNALTTYPFYKKPFGETSSLDKEDVSNEAVGKRAEKRKKEENNKNIVPTTLDHLFLFPTDLNELLAVLMDSGVLSPPKILSMAGENGEGIDRLSESITDTVLKTMTDTEVFKGAKYLYGDSARGENKEEAIHGIDRETVKDTVKTILLRILDKEVQTITMTRKVSENSADRFISRWIDPDREYNYSFVPITEVFQMDLPVYMRRAYGIGGEKPTDVNPSKHFHAFKNTANKEEITMGEAVKKAFKKALWQRNKDNIYTNETIIADTIVNQCNPLLDLADKITKEKNSNKKDQEAQHTVNLRPEYFLNHYLLPPIVNPFKDYLMVTVEQKGNPHTNIDLSIEDYLVLTAVNKIYLFNTLKNIAEISERISSRDKGNTGTSASVKALEKALDKAYQESIEIITKKETVTEKREDKKEDWIHEELDVIEEERPLSALGFLRPFADLTIEACELATGRTTTYFENDKPVIENKNNTATNNTGINETRGVKTQGKHKHKDPKNNNKNTKTRRKILESLAEELEENNTLGNTQETLRGFLEKEVFYPFLNNKTPWEVHEEITTYKKKMFEILRKNDTAFLKLYRLLAEIEQKDFAKIQVRSYHNLVNSYYTASYRDEVENMHIHNHPVFIDALVESTLFPLRTKHMIDSFGKPLTTRLAQTMLLKAELAKERTMDMLNRDYAMASHLLNSWLFVTPMIGANNEYIAGMWDREGCFFDPVTTGETYGKKRLFQSFCSVVASMTPLIPFLSKEYEEEKQSGKNTQNNQPTTNKDNEGKMDTVSPHHLPPTQKNNYLSLLLDVDKKHEQEIKSKKWLSLVNLFEGADWEAVENGWSTVINGQTIVDHVTPEEQYCLTNASQEDIEDEEDTEPEDDDIFSWNNKNKPFSASKNKHLPIDLDYVYHSPPKENEVPDATPIFAVGIDFTLRPSNKLAEDIEQIIDKVKQMTDTNLEKLLEKPDSERLEETVMLSHTMSLLSRAWRSLFLPESLLLYSSNPILSSGEPK